MSKQWPQSVLVRAYVMNNLRYAPVPCEALFEYGASEFGFGRDDIEAAAKHLGATRHDIEGEAHWARPANLLAMWWGNRPAHYYERQQKSGVA